MDFSLYTTVCRLRVFVKPRTQPHDSPSMVQWNRWDPIRIWVSSRRFLSPPVPVPLALSSVRSTPFLEEKHLMCFADRSGAPADLVNVRMQNDCKLPKDKRRNYKHAIDGIVRIVREEGTKKLFNGKRNSFWSFPEAKSFSFRCLDGCHSWCFRHGRTDCFLRTSETSFISQWLFPWQCRDTFQFQFCCRWRLTMFSIDLSLCLV